MFYINIIQYSLKLLLLVKKRIDCTHITAISGHCLRETEVLSIENSLYKTTATSKLF